MSSSELSGYRLRASSPIELRVYDNEFRQVDRGVGSLERSDLQPGIYHLELRAGASSSDKLIKLQPGLIYEDLNLHLKFYSVLPLPSAESADSRHLNALQGLSANPPFVVHDGGAELVVFIRVVSMSATTTVRSRLGSLKVQLLDANLKPVTALEENATTNLDQGWYGTSGRLSAGGYLLRVEEAPGVEGALGGQSVDLVLFLSNRWQTLVCIPVTAKGLQLHGSLVQMLPMGFGGFVPTLELDQESALSLEVATSGLAAGRALVPRRQLTRLLEMKFWNPMLGIIAAYCMFDPVMLPRGPGNSTRFQFKSWRDANLLHTVITNLNSLLPGHPDVLALAELYQTARGPDDREILVGISLNRMTWPPTVALGYRQVLTSEESGGLFILADSLADRARFWTTPCGPWTAWQSENTKRDLAGVRITSSILEHAKWMSPGGILREASLFALAIVRSYLADVARTEEQPFSEVVHQLSLEDLCLNTGLGHLQVGIAVDIISELLRSTPKQSPEQMKFVAPVIDPPTRRLERPLVDQAHAREMLEIGRLQSLYEKELRGYLRARCGSQNLQDVIQESWILINSKIDQFDPERGNPAAFVKYWASIAAMRWYREHKNRSQQTLLFSELTSKFPESVNESDIAEIVRESRLDPEQSLATDEQYRLLLNRTFSSGSPPHQLLAFGFCRILEWRPRRFVEEFSNLPLDEVTTIFEQQYQKEAAEDKAVISKALEGLHRALLLSVAAVVSDPVARVTYAELGGRRVGATRPSEYYRTETPEESVSHWVYAVRRRVQRALSTLKEGQE